RMAADERGRAGADRWGQPAVAPSHRAQGGEHDPRSGNEHHRGQRGAHAEEADGGGQRRADRERSKVEAALVHLADTEQAGRDQPDDPGVHDLRLSLRTRAAAGPSRPAPGAPVARGGGVVQSRAISARANSSGSNGRRSSTDSPTPISLTGNPSSRAIAR